MEGSHQKGSNWYRCQYARRCGGAAAIATGHPQVLSITEDKILDAVLDFLAERIFGPGRLRLLRAELAAAETDLAGGRTDSSDEIAAMLDAIPATSPTVGSNLPLRSPRDS